MNCLPGDILLYRISSSSNWLDKAIGWGQRWIHQAPSEAAYCHAALVGPDSTHIYESVWPKVHNVPLNLTTIQKSLIVEVYRVKNSTPEQVDRVMAYCKKQLGEWYPVSSILTFGFVNFGNRPYCSLLVWRAWLEATQVLCSDEGMITPDELAASALLQKVPQVPV